MHRPARTSAVLVGLLALLATVASVLGVELVAGTPSAAAQVAAPPDPDQPLEVRMRSITPGFVPEHGPVVVRGTVVNRSDETWSAINVHGFIGGTPITTTAGLAEAARTSVTADVGHRITATGSFDHVDELLPGQRARFRVTLRRSVLPVSAPGVYWFGVHALGTDPDGVRSLAGRDRSFLPLVPALGSGVRRVDTSLVLPLRAAVTRSTDGTISDAAGWMQSMRSGPLHAVVAFAQAARGRALTWVLDPAVLDAVRQLALGNPPRTLGTPESSSQGSDPSDGATATAATSGRTSAVASHQAKTARHWLRQVHRLLRRDNAQLLGLPYGDVSDTAARYDLPFLDAAIQRTGNSLSPWGLPLSSVMAPPSGRLVGSVVRSLPRDTMVLLPDAGVEGAAPTSNAVEDRRVVLSSSAAAEGGPGPVDPHSPLALRQRILAETAVRALDPDGGPLVMSLPDRWKHLTRPGFFRGLHVPWVRTATLGGATTGPAQQLDSERLRPPVDQTPLDPSVFSVANDVTTHAQVLQSVLPGNHVLADQVFAETAAELSYSAGGDPYGAAARLRTLSRWVDKALGSIHLQAPESVTLSSARGSFSAQLSNQLDVPVTVRVTARADNRMTITGGEIVPLSPHAQTTVLLNAASQRLGVHNVTLELTNAAGRPLGSSDEFPVRAEPVSRLIWVIIGAGVALLFAAIVVRLTRRILRSRRA